MRAFFLVAFGGAIGSALRYALSLALPKPHPNAFPWATLLVNLAGCFLIGLLAGGLSRNAWLQSTGWLLLATGVCGGLTTFSTFALENVQLLRGHLLWMSLVYLSVSVAAGFLLCALGYGLSRF